MVVHEQESGFKVISHRRSLHETRQLSDHSQQQSVTKLTTALHTPNPNPISNHQNKPQKRQNRRTCPVLVRRSVIVSTLSSGQHLQSFVRCQKPRQQAIAEPGEERDPAAYVMKIFARFAACAFGGRREGEAFAGEVDGAVAAAGAAVAEGVAVVGGSGRAALVEVASGWRSGE